MLDINSIRKDFPILNQKIYGNPLVYFDNAATTQKPNVVLDKIIEFYSSKNSNIHRGVHYLSEQSSSAYEEAREKIKNFINAKKSSEIIFTHGTTESINLVSDSFSEVFIKEGDEIIISEMEHHSNIVTWQRLRDRKKSVLKIIPFDDNGTLIMDAFKKLITHKTKLVSLTHVSNALGIINPIKEIINLAHSNNIPVLIDGAQSIQHLPIDVQELDCDFFTFSGHKIYAETGIGVLYGKEKWLKVIPPYQCGGGMVQRVTFKKTDFDDLPQKFEAGTPNYAAAISLGAAIDYVKKIGINNILAHEKDLIKYTHDQLEKIDGLDIYGNSSEKSSIISFNLNKIHPYDAGMILDKMGIAIRTGTHCAEPVMEHFKINGSIRASFALYNTREEIDSLVLGIEKAKKMLK